MKGHSPNIPNDEPTQVGKKRINEPTQMEQLIAIFAETFEQPCSCIRWEDTTDTEVTRAFIGYRNWSAELKCECCKGSGSYALPSSTV